LTFAGSPAGARMMDFIESEYLEARVDADGEICDHVFNLRQHISPTEQSGVRHVTFVCSHFFFSFDSGVWVIVFFFCSD
jgi:hypothetical protein